MPRRSHTKSHTSAPAVPSVAPATIERAISTVATSDADTFAPSEAQRRAKAKLLVAMRHDPLLDPSQFPARQLAALCGIGERTIHAWFLEDGFKSFFLSKYDAEEQAVFHLDRALECLGKRLDATGDDAMSDKDLIQAAKLLADIVSRQEEAASPEPDFANMPPEQLRAIIERVLPLLPPLPVVGPAIEAQ